MAERQEHQPGTHAPVDGHYEELNVFGTPAGHVEHVREGERLPHGPRGFTWRQTSIAPTAATGRQNVHRVTAPIHPVTPP